MRKGEGEGDVLLTAEEGVLLGGQHQEEAGAGQVPEEEVRMRMGMALWLRAG